MSQQYSYGPRPGQQGGQSYGAPAYPPPPQMSQPGSYAPTHDPNAYQGQPNGAQNQYYQGQYNQGAQYNQNAYYGADAKMPLKPEGFEGERLNPKPKWNDVSPQVSPLVRLRLLTFLP